MTTYYSMTVEDKKNYKVTVLGEENEVYLFSAEDRVNKYFKRNEGKLKRERDIARIFSMSYNDWVLLRKHSPDLIVRDFLEDTYGRLQDDLLDLIAMGSIKNGIQLYKLMYTDEPISELVEEEHKEQDNPLSVGF